MSRLKAILTYDDSWDEESIRNAFEDNDQFSGIVSVEISSTECGGCARKSKGSAEQQTDNNDYATALRLYNEYYKLGNKRAGLTFELWMKERLNSSKAPNCA
jgi:hypothetical protein